MRTRTSDVRIAHLVGSGGSLGGHGGRGRICSAAAVEERLARQAPLAARLRPPTLDEVVGQQHLLGPGQAAAGPHRVRPALVAHPLGAARHGQDHDRPARRGRRPPRRSRRLSAVSAGVKDVREIAERARARLGERGQGTILFLDEVHRFTRAQQDVLLPFVEEGLLVFVGATTENPFFSLTGPLLSRSTLFRLEPLDDDDLARARRPRAHRQRARPRRTNRPTIDDDALQASRRPQRGRRAPPPHRARGRARAHRRGRPRRRSRSTTPRPRSRSAASATATTSTTTSSPRSSSRSAAPIPTPASTGSRACSKRARTRASSRAAS